MNRAARDGDGDGGMHVLENAGAGDVVRLPVERQHIIAQAARKRVVTRIWGTGVTW